MPSSAHPCSYSVPTRNPEPPGPTLNTIPATPGCADRADRHATRVQQADRLAALAMDLAEDAHREAKRDLLPPRATRAPIPGVAPDPFPHPDTRDVTFGHLFAAVARAARQAILLGARLDAGAYDHLPPEAAITPTGRAANPTPPTPHTAASPQPGAPTAAPRPHLGVRAEPLEDDLAEDASRSPEAILSGICAELGRVADLSATGQLSRLFPDRPTQPVAVDLSLRPPPPLAQHERAALLYAEQTGRSPADTEPARPPRPG